MSRAPSSASILRSAWVRERDPPGDCLFGSFEGSIQVCCCRISSDRRFGARNIESELVVEGFCPPHSRPTTLRVVDELVCNVMEHGFAGRSHGRILTRVICRPGIGVEVAVRDDGHGFEAGSIIDGNGFRLLRTVGALEYSTSTEPIAASTTVRVLIPYRGAWI